MGSGGGSEEEIEGKRRKIFGIDLAGKKEHRLSEKR